MGKFSRQAPESRPQLVVYAGEERGYRLRLRNLTSPRDDARQECTWTLTSPHPDGDKVYEGSWVIPQAEG